MAKNDDKPVAIQADPLSQFHMDEQTLRLALVEAQYGLRDTRAQGQATGLLVLINGMELSGKGVAVSQLRQWVDPRLLNVEATLGNMPAKYEPLWQEHVEKLPRHGNITAYFGNWYSDLITGVMQRIAASKEGDIKTKEGNGQDATADWKAYLAQQLQTLSRFEADLQNNHTQVLKCWFHIDEATLQRRLQDQQQDPTWLYKMDWQDKTAVHAFNEIAKVILAQQSDWVVIDGSDAPLAANASKDNIDAKDSDKNTDKQTDKQTNDSIGYSEQATLQFCHEVLHSTQQALISSQQIDSEQRLPKMTYNQHAAFSWADVPDKLIAIDDADMDKVDYQKALAKKQARLATLLRARYHPIHRHDNNKKDKQSEKTADNKQQGTATEETLNHHVIFAFEGMDAAGKGGAIKRLVAPLDPREYQVYNIAAPTENELQHPYLWRFWTRLPQFEPCLKQERLSRVAIFDRTWYGRVLVERIEGFASEAAWQRAYDEINRMEEDLADNGTVILKYWLAIDKKEQLERFEDRKETPHKHFKLTDDDWRNRDKWQDYVQAAADMLARTNTKHAPWHVVATNDKRTARLAVLDHAIKQLEKRIDA